ncbi:MAG TPA: YbaB/EbfC family nucleoid-associated protein [Clostridiales bacterium]|nr:YbaB/EbfC family nucleoid-associated protein [Clostridiales bacterium]
MSKGRRMPGGMPGGNMNNMMKQVQKMQQQMAEVQKELEVKEVDATAGGGAVTAVVNGKKELIRIQISPEVVDPEDVDMLQDLIVAAVTEASKKAEEMMEREMSKVTGGLNLPGMF